jgi:hypothetical protein
MVDNLFQNTCAVGIVGVAAGIAVVGIGHFPYPP